MYVLIVTYHVKFKKSIFFKQSGDSFDLELEMIYLSGHVLAWSGFG